MLKVLVLCNALNSCESVAAQPTPCAQTHIVIVTASICAAADLLWLACAGTAVYGPDHALARALLLLNIHGLPHMLSLTPRFLRAATLATLFTAPSHPGPQRTMSSASTSTSSSSRWPIQPLVPRHTSWPYTSEDFQRADESPGTNFYGPARFVTHIDDNAISTLRSYYSDVLPRSGRILDLCSSWISHFPPDLEAAASTSGGKLQVIGMGMNRKELEANPVLGSWHLVDLNADPTLPPEVSGLDATVCVVSIDYLTRPLEVLEAIRKASNPDATVHLILSNRCFPTKAIGRWLRISEEERVRMVGDYLHFAGWEQVEAVTLVQPGQGRTWIGGGNDPLWVVRGRKGKE